TAQSFAWPKNVETFPGIWPSQSTAARIASFAAETFPTTQSQAVSVADLMSSQYRTIRITRPAIAAAIPAMIQNMGLASIAEFIAQTPIAASENAAPNAVTPAAAARKTPECSWTKPNTFSSRGITSVP